MDLLAFDIGNSRIKVGLFVEDKLDTVFTVDENELSAFINKFPDYKIAVSNVSKNKISTFFSDNLVNLFSLDNSKKLPFESQYKTPLTLGRDRVCNAAALSVYYPDNNKICIDIGTCVKFDFVDKNNRYHGGSISPGLRLRYESLHEKTGNLPLLGYYKQHDLIGGDTMSSIHSGVYFGLTNEIQGFINHYNQLFDNLIVVVTGGDSKHFDLEQKNSIFADENFTIKGLFQIFKLNES